MTPSDDLSNEQIADSLVETNRINGGSGITLSDSIREALDAKDTLLSKLTAERDGLKAENEKLLQRAPTEWKHLKEELAASQERVRELNQQLDSLYSEEPCHKCGYGITGVCYGCMAKEAQEKVRMLESKLEKYEK